MLIPSVLAILNVLYTMYQVDKQMAHLHYLWLVSIPGAGGRWEGAGTGRGKDQAQEEGGDGGSLYCCIISPFRDGRPDTNLNGHKETHCRQLYSPWGEEGNVPFPQGELSGLVIQQLPFPYC